MANTPEDAQARLHHLSNSLMSPFCPGLTISACPSSQAKDLRDTILEKITSGLSDQEIITNLETTYGSKISGLPEDTNLGNLAWTFPIAFLLIGLTLIIVLKNLPKKVNASKNNTSQDFETSTQAEQDSIENKLSEIARKRLSS